MSERLTELRVENRRLKEQVQDLENKVLSLVGMISLESSGGTDRNNYYNDKIINFIHSTEEQINIVTPKIDKFYTTELKKTAERGIPILIITGDRRTIPKEYIPYYEELKTIDKVSIVTNPNVNYLMLFNSQEAFYSGGSLDQKELEKSVLIITTIKEQAKLKKIANIFTLMLPSFMR
ncbi:MAG: hypothetical protein EU548_00090 [Promethearchaeota archaeon]|nr:MAG: hypothetical protein EU548_00090 [Candidatus Lokiarchaeota archaeon]